MNETEKRVNEKIKGNWPRIKGQIMTDYKTASEADMKYEVGQEEDLSRRLQKMTGKTSEEFSQYIDAVESTDPNANPSK